jgi:3-keto-L-gulonate-6-phosphate decarboxylase
MNISDVGSAVRGGRLQVALDVTDIRVAVRLCKTLPERGIILEVGTPLLKAHGIRAIRAVRKESRGRAVFADTKTLDAAEVEVAIAKAGGADGATVSALAPEETVKKFGVACRDNGLICLVDLLGSSMDAEKLAPIASAADILICHGGIDQGLDPRRFGHNVVRLKERFPDKLVAVAGGITPATIGTILSSGADIVIVGRYITNSDNPRETASEMLRLLRGT